MNLWIQIQVVCPKVEKLPRPGRKMLIVIAIKDADLIFKLEKFKGGQVFQSWKYDVMRNPKVEKLPRPGRKMLRKKPNKLGEWREAVAK